MISVHAEANSVAYAARYGISLEGGELFTTFGLCLPCAQLVINTGIKSVYARQAYRDRRGMELAATAGLFVMVGGL